MNDSTTFYVDETTTKDDLEAWLFGIPGGAKITIDGGFIVATWTLGE